jgi:hypothetical protein
MTESGGAESNPFSAEEAPGVQLIVQMRIYDCLIALLTVADEELADNLLAAHAQGKIVTPLPAFKMDEELGQEE